jgi:hypothetical protein
VVFFAFVIDAFSRRIVGWQFASHMRTDLVLDAPRMALSRRPAGADVQLIPHSDAGSQYTSYAFTQLLHDHGAIHQSRDLDGGLYELRRVSRGPVAILTFDATALLDFWLTEYVPEVIATERDRFPAIDHVVAVLGGEVEVIDVPSRSTAPTASARPTTADPRRSWTTGSVPAHSGWVLTGDGGAVARGVARLADDLAAGRWDERHGHLRNQAERVGAVRLIVAR